MTQRLLALLIGLAAAMGLAAPLLPERVTPAQASMIAEDSSLVRVYFDDLQTAHRIAISFEPVKSNYELGYLLLDARADSVARLQNAGVRLEEGVSMDLAFSGARQPFLPSSAGSIPGFACYRTVEQTYATAEAIAASYPMLASWIDIGDSWEKEQGIGGYDLRVLKLTNTAVPGPKPPILVTAAIHAREYTPAELVTRLAEYLVRRYGVDADVTWILDEHEVHLMLHANPDGRKKAEQGFLWRKNTNTAYCDPTSDYRGADLNRNFPVNWGCCGGSSGQECSEIYRGISAASEPETQAVVAYMRSVFTDNRGPGEEDAAPLDSEGIYLDIHSSGRLLLWPWGHTTEPAPNASQLQTLGRKLAYFNGHTPVQAIGLYPTDGTTTGFAYGELGVAALTYELGTAFFESCTYFEEQLMPGNVPSLLYALKVARAPYRLPAGPDVVGAAIDKGAEAPGVTAGTEVALMATIDDTRYENGNGLEPVQALSAAVYYLDRPPWRGGTAVAMQPRDGQFDSAQEEVSAVIDTTELGDGRHTLYMRGRDQDGNWGAVSSLFLYVDSGGAQQPTPAPSQGYTIFLSYVTGGKQVSGDRQ